MNIRIDSDEGIGQSKRRGSWVFPALGGMLLGAVLIAVVAWQMMPKMMIVEHESKYGLDETIVRLKQAIEDAGWICPGVRDMNKSMAKQGVTFDKRVRLVEMCKAEHAKSVLETDRHIATLMPCAIAVYEGDDGKVHISSMNMGLMGKMFGGNIAKVMGGAVAADERIIISSVVKD